jgi:cystathionine gamma-synthase/cystathionine gamma-lyase/cystathionine beta-lyase
MPERRLSTLLVHAGTPHISGAVVTPVFQSANFLQEDVATYGAVRYLRLSNSPQQLALAAKLAAIEGAEDALPLASGMAAISTALLSVLSSGDRLLVQQNTYGGTTTLLADLHRYGIEVVEVDAAAPDTWREACTSNTRAFYVEAESNPLMDVPELDAVVAFARERGLVSLIDATFQSPVGFRAIPFGFDLVLHSATKVLNGHSDLVAGVVAGSTERVARVRDLQHHLGGHLDAHGCFLLDRGLKTLALRVPRMTDNARRVATFLSGHPSVRRVRYPGLVGDPNHARAATFFRHFGWMLSFELDTPDTAERLLSRVRIALHAASLGSTETLLVRPSRSSHLGLSDGERARLGIDDRLVRMSVGIEDPDDLIDDLTQALDVPGAVKQAP